jgi:uncharacterized protein YwgA
MDPKDLLLACLSVAGKESYQPVQIQKLVFLLQEKGIKEEVFNFIPFDYGPFDPQIYKSLEELSDEGLVEIIGEPFAKNRRYRLKSEGVEKAKAALNKLSPDNQEYAARLFHWMKGLSFAQLVGAVYADYPKMRENSVFRG